MTLIHTRMEHCLGATRVGGLILAICAVGSVLAVFTCAQAPPGRQLGLQLTGQELLCEVDNDGPGVVPGIYAVTATGQVQRLLSYGHSPSWSPDRRKVACYLEGEVWVLDVTTRTANPLPPLRQRMTERIGWTPDSTKILLWDLERQSTDTRAGGYALTVKGFPVVSWPQGERQLLPVRGHVGHISFSPDGKLLAYEQHEFVPPHTVRESQIRIVDLASGKAVPFTPPGLTEGFFLRPMWSPDSARLAFDYAGPPDWRRLSFAWELQTGALAPLDPPQSPDWITEVLDVSPTDQHCLLRRTELWGLGESFLSVVSMVSGKKVYAPVPTTNYVHGGCFSPDGRYVAIRTGTEPFPGPTGEAFLFIYDRQSKESCEVEFGDSAIVVDMDW